MNRNKRFFSAVLGGLLALNTCVPAFAVGTGSSNVTLQVETGEEPAIVSVKVPTEIPLKMDKEGTVTVPQDLQITNASDTTDVDLTGLSVVGKNGWSIADYSKDLSSLPEGTKELSMAFRGDGTTDTGDVLLTPDEWTVSKSSSLPMNVTAKLPMQGKDYEQKGDIAQVNYKFAVVDNAGGGEETPDESVISNDWSKDKVLKSSVTPVTFNYDSTNPDTFIESVESSDPSVTVAKSESAAATFGFGNPGSEVWNVTAANKGRATITATLNTGEKTQFDVNVYELNMDDGNNTVTVPDVPDKGAGDSLETGDITIDIPVTTPDGDDTITVTPDIPDDTVLEEGKNTIDVTVDIDGVTVHITIVINIASSNPSNGLTQSVADAQAMGFTFSSYEDGLQIDSFENKQFKSEVNVPEQIGDFKVLKINDNVFQNQTNLKKVTLPDSVTVIGDNAFANCSSLTEAPTMNPSTTLGTGLYSGCTSLTYINLPAEISSIPDKAFNGCTGLTSITIPSSVTTIGTNAFSGCTGVDEVRIPSSVTLIEANAFSNAGSENSKLYIDCNATTDSFKKAHFTAVEFGENCKTIADGAFNSVPLVDVVIPETVTHIGSSFEDNTNLKSFMVKGTETELSLSMLFFTGSEDTVYTINSPIPDGDYRGGTYYGAFTYASGNKIIFGEGVTKLGYQSLSKLKLYGDDSAIVLPSTLTSISNSAFKNASGIKNVYIPSSLETIYDSTFKWDMTVYYSGPASGSPWGAGQVLPNPNE